MVLARAKKRKPPDMLITCTTVLLFAMLYSQSGIWVQILYLNLQPKSS